MAVLVALGCDRSITTQSSPPVSDAATNAPWINLLVPAVARRVGAPMPVEVDVAIPGSTASTTCVALGAGPGTLRPAFPGACNGASQAGLAGGGGGSAGQGGAYGEGSFTSPSETCLNLTSSGMGVSGHTLAIYTSSGSETVVTLVGGLFRDETCTGAPTASVAVVIDLSPTVSGKDAAADAQSAPTTDVASDGGADAADAGDGGTADGSFDDAEESK